MPWPIQGLTAEQDQPGLSLRHQLDVMAGIEDQHPPAGVDLVVDRYATRDQIDRPLGEFVW